MTCGIYIIVNCLSSKYYIGSSKNIEFRFKTHKRKLDNNIHSNKYLQNSWNKDKDYFKFLIIETCNECELLEFEKKWIINSKCYDRSYGYNLMIDPIRNEIGLESKIKISKALKGKRKSEAHVLNMIASRNKNPIRFKNDGYSNGWLGKKHSQETKNKISEALKNRKKRLDENLKINSILHIPSLSG